MNVKDNTINIDVGYVIRTRVTGTPQPATQWKSDVRKIRARRIGALL